MRPFLKPIHLKRLILMLVYMNPFFFLKQRQHSVLLYGPYILVTLKIGLEFSVYLLL